MVFGLLPNGQVDSACHVLGRVGIHGRLCVGDVVTVMYACPVCKGAARQRYGIRNTGEAPTKDDPIVELYCVACKGRGHIQGFSKVRDLQLAQKQNAQKFFKG